MKSTDLINPEYYQTLIHILPDIFYKIDHEGKFIYLNYAVVQIGYMPEELIGKHFSSIFHEDDVKHIQRSDIVPQLSGIKTSNGTTPKLFDERRTGNRVTKNLRIKVRSADGKVGFYGEVIATGVYDDFDDGEANYVGTIGVIRNLSQLERQEQPLIISEKHHRILTSNIIEIMMIITWDGTILHTADSIKKFLGRDMIDLIGDNIYNYIHKDDINELSNSIWTLRRQQISETIVTLRLLDGSDDWRYFETHTKKITNENNKVICFIINAIDVTEHKKTLKELRNEIYSRKLAEQDKTIALHEAEMANNAKNDFLAHMSHEIRNPLNVILGFTEVLMHKVTEDYKDELNSIREAGHSLLDTINKILDYTKLESGKSELDNVSFSTHEFFSRIENMFHSSELHKNVAFSIKTEKSIPPFLFGDQLKLSQIMINLISNSLKFTHEGEISVAATYKSENLNIKISDTGIGIPADKQEEIFLPFKQADSSTTRHYGGTGLGLSIVKEMVDLLRGKIHLASEEGVGSTFILSVPMPPSYFKGTEHSEPCDATFNEDMLNRFILCKSVPNFRILVAEDDENNRKLLKRILKHPMLSIDTVDNGALAVKKIESEAFHLFLLDMHMPVMDGFTVLKKLKESNKLINLPVIVISGHTGGDFEEECFAAGCKKILLKPIDINIFLHTLNDIIAWWINN